MISIIIRTKNEERWIGHCLSAIENQDYNQFEVIVVDNESTDNTLQIVEQARNKLPHLKLTIIGSIKDIDYYKQIKNSITSNNINMYDN